MEKVKKSSRNPSKKTSSLKHIKALILDVDGILTDGSLWWHSPGEWRRTFNIYDGYGIKTLIKRGFITAMITGSHSQDIRERKDRLGIHFLYESAENKVPPFEDFLKKTKLKEHEVAYIGDDLPDVPIMQRVGFSATVPTAMSEAKKVAMYVTKKDGGKGAVRELCDLLLAAKGK